MLRRDTCPRGRRRHISEYTPCRGGAEGQAYPTSRKAKPAAHCASRTDCTHGPSQRSLIVAAPNDGLLKNADCLHVVHALHPNLLLARHRTQRRPRAESAAQLRAGGGARAAKGAQLGGVLVRQQGLRGEGGGGAISGLQVRSGDGKRMLSAQGRAGWFAQQTTFHQPAMHAKGPACRTHATSTSTVHISTAARHWLSAPACPPTPRACT